MEIDRCPPDRLVFEGLQDGSFTVRRNLSGQLTTAKLPGGKNEGVMMCFLVFTEIMKNVDVKDLKKIV